MSREVDLPKRVDEAIDSACKGVSSLQEAALDVYGVYDRDRALLWLCEEVGELLQAIRQGHPRRDVAAELGDVTAWVLCLSNILDEDLAEVVQGALRKEAERQIRQYGRMKYWRDYV